MAERIAYLEAVVGADITQFRKGMRDIRNETGILSETLQGMAGIGRSMTFALTTPILAIGGAMAETATVFDASMRNINSLIKLPQDEFQKLSTEVLNFGMNTRAGANEASEALYSIFSAGYGLDDTSKAMDVLEYSTRLSEAGLSDLVATTETMTATMAMYNDGTLTAAHASDVWANMVAFGVGSLEDFQRHGGKVMASSTALNVSLDNMGATAAFLSQRYSDAGKAMTALSMLESNMLKPNKTLMEAYIKLGVVTGQELVAKFGSLEEAVIAVRGVTDDVDFSKSFSKTGGEAALMMTENINTTRDAMVDFYATINGQTMGEWQQQTQSYAYQIDRLKSAFEGVAIAIGSQIMPIITPFITALADGAVWFAQLNPEVHRFIVVLAGAAAAVGPVLWVLGSLVGTLTPMGLLFKGIIAAVSAFSSNFMGLKDTIVNGTAGIMGSLTPLADSINEFYETLFPDTIEPPDTDKLTGNWVQEVDSGHFLKLTGPTNLWSVFEEQGYADLLSWDEFKKRAYQGGWDGQALTGSEIINLDAMIDPIDEADQLLGSFGKTIQKTKSSMELMMNGGLEDAKGPVIPSTFSERFVQAIQEIGPKALTALGGVMNSIREWVDVNVGKGLNLLASLFAGSSDTNGRTPIYEALKMALNGDIIGAVDAVIPGAGEHLRNLLGTDFGAKIGEALPNIKDGITNLMTNAGAWFINEGVPTLSRSVGYIVGKVGIAFGEVMGNLWGNLTNGNAAKGAGNGLNAIGETIVNPALEGFNDAMKEGNVKNPVDQLFTALSGALVTAAGAWVIGIGFSQGIWAAIKFAISGLASLSIWAGGWALSVLGKLAGALALKAGLPTTFSAAGTAIWDGVKKAIAAVPNLASTIGTAISSSFATGGAIAVGLTLAAGITIGTLLYLAIPEEVRNALNTSFLNVLDDIFGQGAGKHLEDSMNDMFVVAFAAALKAAGNDVQADKMLQQLSGGTALTYTPAVTIAPQSTTGEDISTPEGKAAFWSKYFTGMDAAAMAGMDANTVAIDLANMYTVATSSQMYADMADKGWSPEAWTEEVNKIFNDAETIFANEFAAKEMAFPDINFESFSGTTLLDIPVTDVTLNTDGANVTLTDPTTLVPDSSETIVSYITPDGQVVETRLNEANGKLVEGLDQLGVTIAANMGDGTAIDAEKINQEFLLPLQNNFTTTFGEGGPILTVLATFGTSLSTKFGEYGTHLATANSNLAVGLGQMSLSFTTEFGKVVTAIQEGIDKITDWNLAVMGAANAPSGMAGGGGTLPSHKTGLASVPYDGYVAELHQGERVLTKEEAKDYGTIPRGAIVSNKDTGGGGQNVTQTVVFNEAMSVDRTIRELERKGYRLVKR